MSTIFLLDFGTVFFPFLFNFGNYNACNLEPCLLYRTHDKYDMVRSPLSYIFKLANCTWFLAMSILHYLKVHWINPLLK